MKNVTKHWITTVIGIIMLMSGVYMMLAEYPDKYLYFAFIGGILFLFLKDNWINKIFDRTIK